ncbi:MAG: hypothetical protein JO354_03810 [Verrucomicrobia bacterium]|nr:hypothetical protein [Verrucomicrobiota bacterium]
MKRAITARFGIIVVAAYSAVAAEQSPDDNLARQIAESRMAIAVKKHWDYRTGFTMPPIELADDVSGSDSPQLTELLKKHGTVWKEIDDSFAALYARRLAPLNNQHLKNAAELRGDIAGAIEAAGHARGGGSTSAMLLKYAEAQTEWILRQLWTGTTGPDFTTQEFLSEMRKAVFYFNDTHTARDAQAAAEFSRAVALLSKAENSLTAGQQAIVRQALLEYFKQ